MIIIFPLLGYSQQTLHISNQEYGTLRGFVTTVDKQPIAFANVLLNKKMQQSDKVGRFTFEKLSAGTYILRVSYIGYRTKIQEVILNKGEQLDVTIVLSNESQDLQQVIVTGRESKGIATATIIDRKAMDLLQPSSFTDLLELLPGGLSRDPALTSSNHIRLRETGIADRKFDVSNLGVAFVVDGLPISTQSNMQSWKDAGVSRRNSIARGVDMRSISTDHIESVEIVRGIPSVQYGDLTSGLVKIKRKSGVQPWSARFKADGLSKLFYIGKGIRISPRTTVNMGLDYLDALDDPTNSYENFKRITGMLKSNTEWQTKENGNFMWELGVDFSGNIDNERTDPDVGYDKIDRYRSTYNRTSLSNSFSWEFRKDQKFFKKLEFWQSVSLENEKLDMTKWVQIDGPSAIPNSREQGAHDGIYLPGNYTSTMEVDGKPLNIYAKINLENSFRLGKSKHDLLLGSEWTYDKNKGQGYQYDVTRPPTTGMTTRPRAFNAIPADKQLSLFLEDHLQLPVGKHRIEALFGIRADKLIGISSQYQNLTSWRYDPRINVAWHFPMVHIGEQPLKTSLHVGWGKATRRPVTDQIYPDNLYWDLVQLNYFHENPAYRRINLMTYVVNPTNYEIAPYRNDKKEIRLSMSLGNSELSIGYFKEVIDNGFRNTDRIMSMIYKKYNTDGIDHTTITAAPIVEDLPYDQDTILTTYTMVSNGSCTDKRGIEFQFSTPRINLINTRFTLDGAWFDSRYTNSQPVWRNLKGDQLIGGVRRKYLGLYHSEDGYYNQVFNTKLMVDNYLPMIGLTFITSIQCQWYALNNSAPKDGMPFRYMDVSGQEYPFTEEQLKDPFLALLKEHYPSEAFDKRKTPFSMDINLKATKNIGKYLRTGVFVNRIFQYNKSYVSQGIEYRKRGRTSPYFGIELNVSI